MSLIRHPRTVVAAALAIAFQPAFAAPVEDEAAIVITATRQPTRIDSLISDVTLLERDDIERAGASTLSELLARQPGIQISTKGGGAGSIYIRGNSAKHTLLLIDGMRIGSATLGAPDPDFLSLADIERIEILRGPASSLYGSDAIGGVIQIFTRKGKGATRVSGEVGVGSNRTARVSGTVSGSDERWAYALSAGHDRSKGYNAVTNPLADAYNRDDDGYRTDRMSGRLEFKLAPGHVLGASTLRTMTNADIDYADLWSIPPIPANYDHQTRTENQVDSLYLHNRLSDAWTSTLRVGNGRNDYRHRKSASATDRFATEQLQASWQNDIALPLGKLLLAIEHNKEEVASTTAFADTDRRVTSYLAGWNAATGIHRWQANFRRDVNSQFGGKTTGGLGYGIQFATRWRLSGSIATAFKAPTFNDLYWPGAGNPNLTPEKSRNREIALIFEEGSSKASATLFRNDLEDLIEWAPAGGGLWLPSNVAKARIHGLTLAAESAWGNWQNKVSFDWLDAKDKGTDLFLRYRSEYSARANLLYSGAGWRAGTELSLHSHRYDDTANAVRLPGYGLLNIVAERNIDKQVTLFARIDNVFDKKYLLIKDASPWAAPSDFGVPGRTVFVGARFTMK
jgi:vitamin B12 transporter